MDLDAKIGQLLMAGFRGLVAAPGDPVLRDLEQHRLGSVVLFEGDRLRHSVPPRATHGLRLVVNALFCERPCERRGIPPRPGTK